VFGIVESASIVYDVAETPNRTGASVVGIVVVSHSREIASGTAALAGQMAGPAVPIEPAGGTPDGGLGTDADRVREAIASADSGDGVIVLGDLGSAILTVRAVLAGRENGHVRLVDAPLVEGAVAAAVTASAGLALDEVEAAAKGAAGAAKF
jgi:PTS hybrid protein